eukprot:Selendium_serpulae@DN4016_c0_g1_i1.p1
MTALQICLKQSFAAVHSESSQPINKSTRETRRRQNGDRRLTVGRVAVLTRQGVSDELLQLTVVPVLELNLEVKVLTPSGPPGHHRRIVSGRGLRQCPAVAH